LVLRARDKMVGFPLATRWPFKEVRVLLAPEGGTALAKVKGRPGICRAVMWALFLDHLRRPSRRGNRRMSIYRPKLPRYRAEDRPLSFSDPERIVCAGAKKRRWVHPSVPPRSPNSKVLGGREKSWNFQTLLLFCHVLLLASFLPPSRSMSLVLRPSHVCSNRSPNWRDKLCNAD